MNNPFVWAVCKIHELLWEYQFKRTPVTHLGSMLVKDFKGALYCVGYDEIRVRTLDVLRSLPHDTEYLPVKALIETIEKATD